MGKSYSGLFLLVSLVAMYIIGVNLPNEKKVITESIPKPPKENIENVVNYDFKTGQYNYIEPVEAKSTGPIITQPKREVEYIYIENNRPISKREFEYMVEDYIQDNWDDLRDKFGN